MRVPLQHRPATRSRRGLTTPAVAIALLLAMAGLALIVDRIWLETAQLELTTACEAAALASVRQLASDDRLIPNSLEVQRLDAARTAAEQLAAVNPVAGQLPSFAAFGSDLIFGNYARPEADGPIVFDPADADPRSVRVTLHRSRGRNNPVALFIGGLTRVPFGDVVRQADATIDNRIQGIRPVSGATAPVLPLAVWKIDPAGNRLDTWDAQIEQRRGHDDYGVDPQTHRPIRGGDGIPELTLRSLARGGNPAACNLQVVNFGNGFDDQTVARQFRTGLSAEDLASAGTMLPANGGTWTTSPELRHQDREALDDCLGQQRICLLYAEAVALERSQVCQTECVALVAVRVMSVQDQTDGSCVVVVQPTVMATRSAVMTAAVGQTSTFPENKYIYNIQLTN